MRHNLPSIKTLKTIAFERAAELRAVLEITTNSELDKVLESGKYPATQSWVRSCFNSPRFHELKFAICDEILGNYGVEVIPGRGTKSSPRIEYSNSGDTYTNTLLFVRGRYLVGSWGDIVERGNYA